MSREFIVRARAAPTDAGKFAGREGDKAHVAILAHCLMNGLFLAKRHRPDTLLHLVLESGSGHPRTLTYDGACIKDLGGFSEAALLESIAFSLREAAKLQPGEIKTTQQGVQVQLLGFDKLVRTMADNQCKLMVLARKGTEIRQMSDALADGCFILTDHVPMPAKTLKYLSRLGAQKISLGPQELFASQCITLIHNELDRL